MRHDELIEEFEAESEDGQRFVLHVYETLEEITPLGTDTTQWLATGLKRITTSLGQVCNRIDDDTFEIVASHLQVRRVARLALVAKPEELASGRSAAAAGVKSSPGTAKATAFISYSHEDKAFAHALCAELRLRGVQPWIDDEGLLVGDSLVQKIGEAIADNDFLIALVSKASTASSWCQKELSLAMTHGINLKRVKVLPVRLDGAAMPYFLSDTKYLPGDSRRPDGLAEELSLAMERHLGLMNADVQKSFSGGDDRAPITSARYEEPWAIVRGPMNLASSGRDAAGYAWEIRRGGESRRVLVWISGSASASELESLPPEVTSARRTRGRSVVDRVLSMSTPPAEVLVATHGIRLSSETQT